MLHDQERGATQHQKTAPQSSYIESSKMYLIFDTETTGFPKNEKQAPDASDNWPRLVQLSWQLHDAKGALVSHGDQLIRPVGFDIPRGAERVHGISTALAEKKGAPLAEVLDRFEDEVKKTKYLVGHNLDFDKNTLLSEYIRLKKESTMTDCSMLDTMKDDVALSKATASGKYGRPKYKRLTELYELLFDKPLKNAHNAAYDVEATAQCFFEMLAKGKLQKAPQVGRDEIHYEPPKELSKTEKYKKEEKKSQKKISVRAPAPAVQTGGALAFCHLRAHSQHALSPGTLGVEDIIKTAKEHNMEAVALTDLGNLFGAFQFVKHAEQKGIKPIVGCEFYLSDRRKEKKFTREQPDKRWQQVLLAKNAEGYKQLCQLSSLGYTEGLYGLYPRIDKALIQKHKDHLIALSGNARGELARTILHDGKSKAQQVVEWWLDVFGDDFYIELMPHEEEAFLQDELLGLAQRHGVKVVATSDIFYGQKEEAKTHEILMKIKTMGLRTANFMGKKAKNPSESGGYYFRSGQEMKACFSGVPEALTNTMEVAKKVTSYAIRQKVMLPRCTVPTSFASQDEYLAHLSHEGAKKRYGALSSDLKKRLTYELGVIKKMNFAGYFITVERIVREARKRNIAVGPGRGSAAGSLVVYCIGITSIDPIRYGLLFERFLNPERVSLPDIDVDFDDERRDELIGWIRTHYGEDRVAQIVTYNTMGARLAIRDCARVMDFPLHEANQLANMIPKRLGCTLEEAYKENPALKEVKDEEGPAAAVLVQAEKLEGSVRNISTHACGLIIAPTALQKVVPLMVSKETQFLITQYDNRTVEEMGLLKIDLLGLRTLSVLRKALLLIEKNHGKKIDLENLSLDDAETYALYQRGDTHAVFQFESGGMQRYLKELKPDCFEDLVAMNSLYRPGPMEHIPRFIARKSGKEPITYDLPVMERHLKETYGITIYQEQVMLLAQELAGFSRNKADNLRKAMGKKEDKRMEKLKPAFEKGCQERGHDLKVCEEIWREWESFAKYAFNKSHAAAYSLISYQSAYLKAHYPTEFMAATLSSNLNQMDRITALSEECQNMGITLLPPNINEADVYFSPRPGKKIVFALAGIKGMGRLAAEHIVAERDKAGFFHDIFDFAERMEHAVKASGPPDKQRTRVRGLGRGTYELLAEAGCFDAFPDHHRRAYLEPEKKNLIEAALQAAQKSTISHDEKQSHLFSSGTPKAEESILKPYTKGEEAQLEKERLGLYLSAHPMAPFRPLIQGCGLGTLADLDAPSEGEKRQNDRPQRQAVGLLTGVEQRKNKRGEAYSIVALEDVSGSFQYRLWGTLHEAFHKHKDQHTGIFPWYVSGKMSYSKFKRADEFKTEELMPFSTYLSRRTEGLVAEVVAKDLNNSLIDRLEALLKAHTGDYPFHICVRDGNTRLHLSKKEGIALSEVFMSTLAEIKNVSLSLRRGSG